MRAFTAEFEMGELRDRPASEDADAQSAVLFLERQGPVSDADVWGAGGRARPNCPISARKSTRDGTARFRSQKCTLAPSLNSVVCEENICAVAGVE